MMSTRSLKAAMEEISENDAKRKLFQSQPVSVFVPFNWKFVSSLPNRNHVLVRVARHLPTDVVRMTVADSHHELFFGNLNVVCNAKSGDLEAYVLDFPLSKLEIRIVGEYVVTMPKGTDVRELKNDSEIYMSNDHLTCFVVDNVMQVIGVLNDKLIRSIFNV